MITVSSLLDQEWHKRYKAISKLNIRSSIYDITNKCNLRCKGCFFFSSDEHKAAAGAGPDVVRLSVGLEDTADLIADLDQALAKA